MSEFTSASRYPPDFVAHTDEICRYVCQVVEDLCSLSAANEAAANEPQGSVPDLAFDVLSRKDFTYLSKSRCSEYRASIIESLERDIVAGQPLRFYYDIGGGYHAGIDSKLRLLSFDPSLGELLALRQIRIFDALIRSIYAPGTRFSLVVDNICAFLVNEIPLDRTAEYCSKLRGLIEDLKLEGLVDVFIESEHFSLTSYELAEGRVFDSSPESDEIENVRRFLGRECDVKEVGHRLARYAEISEQTDDKINSVIRGVRMTQRATPSTFGFRSFPGGDSRIQAGEVILTFCDDGKVRPQLITSNSKIDSEIWDLDVADVVPLPGKTVSYSFSAF